jgi:hypothetical protein
MFYKLAVKRCYISLQIFISCVVVRKLQMCNKRVVDTLYPHRQYNVHQIFILNGFLFSLWITGLILQFTVQDFRSMMSSDI